MTTELKNKILSAKKTQADLACFNATNLGTKKVIKSWNAIP